MSEQQPPAAPQNDSNQEDWHEPDPEELRRLEECLAELREQGVLVKGDGIRGSLKMVAYIPGAVDRFLEGRGSKRKQWRPQ